MKNTQPKPPEVPSREGTFFVLCLVLSRFIRFLGITTQLHEVQFRYELDTKSVFKSYLILIYKKDYELIYK